MKFTLSWLKEHLDTTASLEEILERLTSIGLEVESVKNPGAALKDFRIVEIMAAEKHPNADRLKVLHVNTGLETLQVVCGDPKVEAGMKGVLAHPGVYVPGLDMTMKASQIRGVESHGMMCSLMEMGLAESSEGIVQLASDAPVGKDYRDYAHLNDPRIEVAITPNRGDCLGIRGIARDLSATGIGTLKPFSIPPVDSKFANPYAVTLDFSPETQAACPLFAGRFIQGVKNGPSPQWLKQRLEAVGVRSISILVDVTNLLCYELGRPMHVFDADMIDCALTVRLSRQDEKILALDDKEYALDSSTVVVEDGTRLLSIAGIMGGKDSACSLKTENVYIESALFDPIYIAKAGRKLNLLSDSRYRFERGVDADCVIPALERATQLILDMCGGEPSTIEIAGSQPQMNRVISFSIKRVLQLGGIDIEREKIIAILRNLGFTVKETSEILSVSVPSWRHDVEREEDLIEEVLRMHGLDKIPPLPFDTQRYHQEDEKDSGLIDERREWISRRVLAERGLIETFSWSFLSKEQAFLFGWKDEGLRVENPISADLSIMRPSILPHLISGAVKNFARGQENSYLFEIGAQYRDSNPSGQENMASGIRTQAEPKKNWGNSSKVADIWDAKADALAVIEACGMDRNSLQTLTIAPDYYHPGKSAALCLGPKNVLAYFGQLHPTLQKYYDLPHGISMFEVFLNAIPSLKGERKKEALSVSPYQAVDRDFAFVVEVTTPAETILKVVKNADKALITEVALFDIYQGDPIAEGKKSIAIGVRLQSQHKTLTDEEINAISSKIIKEVEQATGGVLRQ